MHTSFKMPIPKTPGPTPRTPGIASQITQESPTQNPFAASSQTPKGLSTPGGSTNPALEGMIRSVQKQTTPKPMTPSGVQYTPGGSVNLGLGGLMREAKKPKTPNPVTPSKEEPQYTPGGSVVNSNLSQVLLSAKKIKPPQPILQTMSQEAFNASFCQLRGCSRYIWPAINAMQLRSGSLADALRSAVTPGTIGARSGVIKKLHEFLNLAERDLLERQNVSKIEEVHTQQLLTVDGKINLSKAEIKEVEFTLNQIQNESHALTPNTKKKRKKEDPRFGEFFVQSPSIEERPTKYRKTGETNQRSS